MPWYKKGLRFECVRCGNCCTGEPGTIAITETDMDRLSEYLGLPLHAFREIYCRTLRDGTVSLREKVNGHCIFFKNGKECIIYDLRPKQCRTWPFWSIIIRSPGSWAKEAETCKGMNRGPLHSSDKIQKISDNDGTHRNNLPSDL